MIRQNAETKLKLALLALISEELEQIQLGHRKGWLKSKSSALHFKGKTVPILRSKQRKRLILELCIVGLCKNEGTALL